MPRFFISYRRSDSQGQYLAHMIYREISKRYGKNSVFMDVDSSSPGLSFPKKLELALARADAVLVIIGSEWLARLNEKREDERDWVRFEISESLKREGLPVVPICNIGVNLPAPSQLPSDIMDLAMRDGISLDPFRDFDSHLNRFLIDLRCRRIRLGVWPAGAFASLVLILVVIWQFDVINLLKSDLTKPETTPVIQSDIKSDARQKPETTPVIQSDIKSDARQKPETTPVIQSDIKPDTQQKPETTPVIQSDIKPDTQQKPEMPSDISGRQIDLKNTQVPTRQSPAKLIQNEAATTLDHYPAKPFVLFRDTLKDGTPGPEMVSLPGGSFQMGSPRTEADRYSNEGPQHRVSLQPFAISRTEVSFADYDRFAAATGKRKPDDRQWGRGTQPVINVDWQDAKAYAQWLSQQTGKNYRLPTEAEWEYAARAGTPTAFWTGNCIDTDQANYNGNYDYAGCGAKTGKYRQRTVPVGSLPANPWSLYEMAGNVWEWTEDCWHGSYQNAPPDGAAWLDAAGGDCARRVLRGGSWYYVPQVLRSSYRFSGDADGAFLSVGIRLARTP